MTKKQLIEKVREKMRLSKTEATHIVDAFFNSITNALIRRERVEIRNLFNFYVKKYKPYVGRNPKTGKKINVKIKEQPFFKCGKELKEQLQK